VDALNSLILDFVASIQRPFNFISSLSSTIDLSFLLLSLFAFAALVTSDATQFFDHGIETNIDLIVTEPPKL
jgi:hypothetical protein